MSDAMNDNDNDDEAPDPGEAFEALRKEVAGQGWATRKEVEALRAAVEVLQNARGVDYTPTLTALDQGRQRSWSGWTQSSNIRRWRSRPHGSLTRSAQPRPGPRVISAVGSSRRPAKCAP